jgi:formylglycine-generating enzyme required for sulfatase activity
MRLVPAGYHVPVHASQGPGSWVEAFWLDAQPVTNAEFLAFVREHPRWRRSIVSPDAADASYLANWAGDLELGPQARPRQPVTFVSWFAATGYCRARDARLPTEAEWEWAALPAGPEERERIRARILAFYGRPRQPLPEAGASPPNRYGLRDQHGVIFEWVSDASGDRAARDARLTDRRPDERPPDGWCGGAAAGATDARDYAGFMRHAFRSSLEPRFALHHLGFRCAVSRPPGSVERPMRAAPGRP